MRFHVTKAEDSILKSDKWLLYKLGSCVAEDDLELLLLLPPLSRAGMTGVRHHDQH